MKSHKFSAIFALLAGAFSLLALSGAALADKQLIINDSLHCDLEDALINVATGNMEVLILDPELCLGVGEGLAVSPALAEPASVSQGAAFSLVWASVGAVQCQLGMPFDWSLTGTVGTSSVVRIGVPGDANVGNYPLTVTCTDESGENASSEAVVSVIEAEPDSPPATPSLSREVLDGVAPGEVRLTWSSSSGATDCEALSNPSQSAWGGSVGTGSNQQVTLSGLAAGSYEFRLRCSNSAGSSDWRTVTANIGVSTQCANRPPPDGWSRIANGCVFQWGVGWIGSSDCTDWEGIWPSPFIDSTGSTRRVASAGRSGPRQYLAIEVSTAGMPTTKTGRVTAGDDGFAHPPNTIVTISSCPGDFHEAAVMEETGCYAAQNVIFSAYQWGGVNTSRTCKLESNRTYYLNIIPTSSPLGTHPDSLEPHPNCESGPCGFVYEPQ